MRFSGGLFIHLSRLEKNYRHLKSICPQNQTLFIIKANAYGHGMKEIATFAHKELGINEFGLATLKEGLALREYLKGEFETYIFSDLQLNRPDLIDHYTTSRLLPVLSSMKHLDCFLDHPGFKHSPLCLEFNIGMNRLGISYSDVEQVAKKIKKKGRISIYHLMGHYACSSASIKDNPYNKDATSNFQTVKKFLEAQGISLERTSIANSGAIEQHAGLEESHVRPGLMLYGPSSLEDGSQKSWKGSVISNLETEVLQTFRVKTATPVGYGATLCLKDGLLAIIALGHGDGFATDYCGVKLEHRGFYGQVIGRVSMDTAQILFPEEASIKTGEKLIVWNQRPEILEHISRQSNIHPHELFARLTGRLPRFYLAD